MTAYDFKRLNLRGAEESVVAHQRVLLLRPAEMCERDRRVMAQVVSAWRAGRRGTVRDMARRADLPPSTFWNGVLMLQRQGWVQRTPAGVLPGPRFAGTDKGQPLYVVGGPQGQKSRLRRRAKWDRRSVMVRA